jgi:5-methylcytosine-specific restriction enzyme subunit McrC
MPITPEPPTRTVLLRERTPRVVRLHREDALFLAEHHTAHLDLLPAGPKQLWRITPRGVAGVILAPRCRLIVRPKVPLRSLFFLLDPQAPPAGVGAVEPEREDTALVDFLAGQLALRVLERAASGLYRGYRERPQSGPFLHGRLDVSATLRESPRRDQLHSHHDDFTVDVPCNQFPRAVLAALLETPLCSEPVRLALRQAEAALADVTPLTLDADTLARLGREPAPPGYEPLLELCRLLARGLAPAFVLPLDVVFERYLTRGLIEHLAPDTHLRVAVQEPHTVTRSEPSLVMRPDLLLCRDGRPAIIVDAKWKPLDGAPPTDDLHQMIAYCASLGVERAVLVYPGRRDEVRTYELAEVAMRIEVRTLRVTASPERCRRSLRRLARALNS